MNHNSTTCPVCRSHREIDTELVRDDLHNAVSQEWKKLPLVRTGQGYYTQDYTPIGDDLSPINWLNVAMVAACVVCGAFLLWLSI